MARPVSCGGWLRKVIVRSNIYLCKRREIIYIYGYLHPKMRASLFYHVLTNPDNETFLFIASSLEENYTVIDYTLLRFAYTHCAIAHKSHLSLLTCNLDFQNSTYLHWCTISHQHRKIHPLYTRSLDNREFSSRFPDHLILSLPILALSMIKVYEFPCVSWHGYINILYHAQTVILLYPFSICHKWSWKLQHIGQGSGIC